MRKVIVIGSTGPTGRHVVRSLIERKREVRAITRAPRKVPPSWKDQVEVFKADLRDPDSLKDALKDDFGALIICSGTRNLFGFGNNTGKETEVMGMRNILTAIGDRSPKIAFVSTILVTRRRSHPLGWLLNTIRGGVLEQKLEAEELLRSTSLPYLILRPGGLTNATAGKAYLHFDQDDRVMGMVARADVANVLVEWVDSHLKSRVTCELIGKPRKLYDTNWPEQFNDLISY